MGVATYLGMKKKVGVPTFEPSITYRLLWVNQMAVQNLFGQSQRSVTQKLANQPELLL